MFARSWNMTVWFGRVRLIPTPCGSIEYLRHKFLIWLLSNTTSRHAASMAYSNILNHVLIRSLSSHRVAVQHDLLFSKNNQNQHCQFEHWHTSSHAAFLSMRFHFPLDWSAVRTQTLFDMPRPRVNTRVRVCSAGHLIYVVYSLLGTITAAGILRKIL